MRKVKIGKHRIHLGDCRKLLKKLEDNSLESIVSDPPYEISFMGKGWDATGIAYNVKMWKQCLRVLKPGGFAVIFGATRTFHRIATAMEDAGFEIIEAIGYVHAKGQPKSLDVSKMIDKSLGNELKTVGYRKGMSGSGFGNTGHGKKLVDVPVKMAASNEARKYQGVGTGLRPVMEPIIIARKPIEGKLIDNVRKHGTGGMNIDAARFGVSDFAGTTKWLPGYEHLAGTQGKWPTTFALSHHEDCVKLKSVVVKDKKVKRYACVPECPIRRIDEHLNDPSGFFFSAKPSPKERNLGLKKPNSHTTVKPIDLMRHLVALFVPKGGKCYDPFTGSGTTAIACELEGRRFVGTELIHEHFIVAKRRLRYAHEKPEAFAFTDFRTKRKSFKKTKVRVRRKHK